MAGETHKIDWIADISIETDYIVGLHDNCDCRRVGKGAEWLFEFWFGSEILTANIDFAPYAKKNWVTGEINNAVLLIENYVNGEIASVRNDLLPRIVANEDEIEALKRRVTANEDGISGLKAEDTKIWNAINAIKTGDGISLVSLIREDARINKRIDDLAEQVGSYHNAYISRFGNLENRVLALENYIANWNPGEDGGDNPPVIIPPVAGDYISKLVDDYANGVITFKKGIRIGDGTNSILIDYSNGAVRVNGNAFTTGWLSAYGRPSVSGGDSGGGSESDNPGGSEGGGNPSTPADLSEYIKRIDADARYIRKDQADSTSFPVTFKDGIVLANGDKYVRLELDQEGYVKINGNVYATGWMSASGKPGLSGGDSGSTSGIDEDQLWRILSRNDSEKKIHGSHIMVDGVTIKQSSTGVLYAVARTSDGEEDTTDLSNYYTKSEIDKILVDDYYTYQQVNDLLEDYYTKDELTGDDGVLSKYWNTDDIKIIYGNNEGYPFEVATEQVMHQYVADFINLHEFIVRSDLDSYVTYTWINTELETLNSKYIKKNEDDETSGIVNFENGIMIGGILIEALPGNIVRVNSNFNATGEVSALA